MLRLTHIFVIYCIHVVFNFYVSNTVVTPPSPSPVTLNFNRMNIHWYEQNHHLERKYPSFAPLGIFNFFVISFIFILSLFMMLLHLCNSVRYVTFTTNLTLHRKKKRHFKATSIFNDICFTITGWVALSWISWKLPFLPNYPPWLWLRKYLQFRFKIS